MGMERDLSTRPLVFNPEGFLVAILDNTEACERARTALLEAGFATVIFVSTRANRSSRTTRYF